MLSHQKIRKSFSLDDIQQLSPKPKKLPTTGKKPRSQMKLMESLNVQTEQFLKIYCRIRPLEQRGGENEPLTPSKARKDIYEVVEGNRNIRINMEESVIAKNGGGAEFGFSGVLGQDSSQTEVFDQVCRPMLEEMLGGMGEY